MKNFDNYNKRTLTIDEAAEYTCVGRSTIENWLAKGLLSCEELQTKGKDY